MQERPIKRLKNVSKKLIGPTRACKICFRKNNDLSLLNIINGIDLCNDCSKKLRSKFVNFDIQGINCLSIFEYDEIFRELIYQFKGCYDYELKNIFLGKYLKELKILYKGYTIIPAPSSEEDNIKRGFNHVEEIFSLLNLPMEKVFVKEGNFKQAEHNFNERKGIKDHLKLVDVPPLNTPYLLVDDIYTTGATMRSMIDILKLNGINNLKVLVLCKTKPKDYI